MKKQILEAANEVLDRFNGDFKLVHAFIASGIGKKFNLDRSIIVHSIKQLTNGYEH